MSAENPAQILDGILGTSVSMEQGFKSTNDVQSYLRRSDRSRENIPINFSVDPSVTILERKCTFIHFLCAYCGLGPEFGDIQKTKP